MWISKMFINTFHLIWIKLQRITVLLYLSKICFCINIVFSWFFLSILLSISLSWIGQDDNHKSSYTVREMGNSLICHILSSSKQKQKTTNWTLNHQNCINSIIIIKVCRLHLGQCQLKPDRRFDCKVVLPRGWFCFCKLKWG